MTNEFADAIKPGPPPPTHQVDHPHFYQHAHEQQALEAKARNMTRQQLFDNGFITVEDLDDEELRAGICRDAHGRIPKPTKTMDMVPRDLYDAMVAEHAKRFDEKLRQQLDSALDTMARNMVDPTVEPKDQMYAATWFVDRVRGKSVERVAVQVTKAPYEELLSDVAHITKAQHEAMKRGAIDVESYELPEGTVPEGVSPVHEAGAEPTDAPGVSGGQGDQHGHRGQGLVDQSGGELRPGENVASQYVATHDSSGERERGAQDGSAWELPLAPTPFDPLPEAPSFDNLATSNPVAPKTLSEQIRGAQDRGIEVAQARANRKTIIENAKKRRRMMRATGTDVLVDALTGTPGFAQAQERLLSEDTNERRDGDAG